MQTSAVRVFILSVALLARLSATAAMAQDSGYIPALGIADTGADISADANVLPTADADLIPATGIPVTSAVPTATGTASFDASSKPSDVSNLTDHLLSKYASRYHTATTSPTFFHQVLNDTVSPARVAYFFEQDLIYGRGFLTLVGQTLGLLTADLEQPESEELLTRVGNLGTTASGLSDEGGLLRGLRGKLVEGSGGEGVSGSEGTLEYV
jgi:hypothetical protein